MSVQVLSNVRVGIITRDWDAEALDSIASGVSFRITEPGKSDIDQQPGYYSIHSPLYGTEYGDEHAYEDRYSCKCGNLIGKNFDGVTCPKCKTKVEFVDIDMTKTGRIIIDDYCILQSAYYKKLRSFLGAKILDSIFNYVDPELRPDPQKNQDHPYTGIGITEFQERFDEVMRHYLKKATTPKKQYLYKQIMSHKEQVFTHSIPVYSSHLRLFVIKQDEIKYSDEDKLFKQIFTNVQILNNKFDLTKRVESILKKKFRVDQVRAQHVLYKIQLDLDKLWNLTFETVKKKTGTIRDSIVGGRLNYTARNVIIPSKDLRADEIIIGYTTFLEMFKLEIISILVNMQHVEYVEAWSRYEKAQINFDPYIYKIMEYMVNNNDIICEINRNQLWGFAA